MSKLVYLFMLFVCILVLLYTLKVGKIKKLEFTALLLTIVGGILMNVLGKNPMGYLAVGIFIVGALLQIIERIVRK
jgi:hypothetical protein